MESIIAFACVFFFLMNFFMFMTVWEEYWNLRGIVTIAIIDLFYALFVCVGVYLASAS